MHKSKIGDHLPPQVFQCKAFNVKEMQKKISESTTTYTKNMLKMFTLLFFFRVH